VSKPWTEILRAKTEIDAGQYDRAVGRLAPVFERHLTREDDDARLAATSLLAHARYMNGNQQDSVRAMQRVYEFRHDPGAEAGLFKAVAEVWIDPTKAIATVEAAAKKRSYPSALLIRASARSPSCVSHIKPCIDPSGRKRLAIRGIVLGKHNSVILGKLQAHCFAYVIAQHRGDSAASDAHLAELLPVWPILKRYHDCL